MVEIVTGEVLSCSNNGSFIHLKDGAVAWSSGEILFVGASSEAKDKYPEARVLDQSSKIILPGFVDCHLHFPQFEIIGCHGEELLGWLERYTFPTEASFKDNHKAERVAEALVDELLANGTTTAVLFSSSDYRATQSLFQILDKRGYRAVVGKTAMDRNCPDNLVVTPEDEYHQSKELIEEFDGRADRLHYAITPRFAPTSTPELLEVIAKLKNEYPNLYVQTHWAENKGEIQWVSELFPSNKSYLDVYDSYNILGDKTLLAHGIHITEEDLERLAQTSTRIVHCPTSNMFLGSGLFPSQKYRSNDILFSMGTDIGGGSTLSMWKTMLAAYKMQKLQGVSLSPAELFRMATLDGAKVLGLENQIGSLEKGKKCDLQVVDARNVSWLKRRWEESLSTEELLFSLIALGDDRMTEMVVIDGEVVFSRRKEDVSRDVVAA